MPVRESKWPVPTLAGLQCVSGGLRATHQPWHSLHHLPAALQLGSSPYRLRAALQATATRREQRAADCCGQQVRWILGSKPLQSSGLELLLLVGLLLLLLASTVLPPSLRPWCCCCSCCCHLLRPCPCRSTQIIPPTRPPLPPCLPPQALNNAGLVLTDLSNLRPPADRAAFSRHAILRFRRAVRLRPDFERAIYNLGTVAYAAACVQQEELLSGQEQPSPLRRVRGGGGGSSSSSASANELVVKGAFAHAAQYIAIAYAMQPGKAVYADSLAVVQRLLPLPHLRAGPLLAVHPATLGGPAESWVSCWFALDSTGLHVTHPPLAYSSLTSASPPQIRFPVDDIVDARAPCTDPSLPRGTALWLGLASQRVGVYLVAEQQEDAEGWVDAIILLRHLHEQRSLEGLEKALTMAVGKPQRAA